MWYDIKLFRYIQNYFSITRCTVCLQISESSITMETLSVTSVCRLEIVLFIDFQWFFMQPPWPLCPWFDQWWNTCEANVVIDACWTSSCVTVQSIPHLGMMTSSKAQLWRPLCHLVHSEDTKCSLLCVQTMIWLSSFNDKRAEVSDTITQRLLLKRLTGVLGYVSFINSPKNLQHFNLKKHAFLQHESENDILLFT